VSVVPVIEMATRATVPEDEEAVDDDETEPAVPEVDEEESVDAEDDGDPPLPVDVDAEAEAGPDVLEHAEDMAAAAGATRAAAHRARRTEGGLSSIKDKVQLFVIESQN
jgi:hypothetical protein